MTPDERREPAKESHQFSEADVRGFGRAEKSSDEDWHFKNNALRGMRELWSVVRENTAMMKELAKSIEKLVNEMQRRR